MNARRRTIATLLTAAAVAVGCQDKKTQPDKAQQSSQEALLAQKAPIPSPDAPAPQAPPISDIELIAQKAELHARRVADEMQKQAALAKQGIAQAPPPQPSAVEWMDPNAFRIGPAPREEATPSKPHPTPQLTPTSASMPAPVITPVEPDPAEPSTANRAISIEDSPAVAVASVKTAMIMEPAALPKPAPPGSPAAGQLQSHLTDLIRNQPRDISAHLDYQLLQFVQGKPAPDLAAAATLPEEDQEIVTAVLDALSNFRHTLKSEGNPLLSRKVKPLMDLGERLRARADLEVPTIQFCKRVDGFGVYEPMAPSFVAGREHEVIIYCEIENFMSQLGGQGQWETKVSEEIVLYTENDGLPILREKPVGVADTCRNRRNDFFIVRKLRFPSNIPVGRYLLKVTVVDQLASRVAEATLPVTFVAN